MDHLDERGDALAVAERLHVADEGLGDENGESAAGEHRVAKPRPADRAPGPPGRGARRGRTGSRRRARWPSPRACASSSSDPAPAVAAASTAPEEASRSSTQTGGASARQRPAAVGDLRLLEAASPDRRPGARGAPAAPSRRAGTRRWRSRASWRSTTKTSLGLGALLDPGRRATRRRSVPGRRAGPRRPCRRRRTRSGRQPCARRRPAPTSAPRTRPRGAARQAPPRGSCRRSKSRARPARSGRPRARRARPREPEVTAPSVSDSSIAGRRLGRDEPGRRRSLQQGRMRRRRRRARAARTAHASAAAIAAKDGTHAPAQRRRVHFPVPRLSSPPGKSPAGRPRPSSAACRSRHPAIRASCDG